MKDREPTGIVLPIRPKHLKRIMNGANIVCKNVGPHLKKIKSVIKKGMKFYIYETSPKSEISAKAEIESVEFLTFSELFKKYRASQCFASHSEIRKYMESAPDRKMMVLKLKRINFKLKTKPAFPNPTLGHQYIYS